MPEKVRSVLVESARDLQSKYEEIYKSPETWLYAKSHGVHSTIVTILRERLAGAAVLDVGCGAGRLSLMCERFAATVEGFDFSPTAIEIARLNARATRSDRTSFSVATLDTYSPERQYDVILLVGVLEHVPDPLATVKQLSEWLRPGGVVVVSCPHFLNQRGFTYMPLLTLFGLPMSLADLRQVFPRDIQDWAAAAGMRITLAAGAIYRFGWGLKGAQDLVRRVPAAVADRGFDAGVLDFESFNQWLLAQAPIGEQMLEALAARGILRRIERPVTLHLQPVEEAPPELFERMRQYINEDVDTDPYWCTEPPFQYLGGEGIYLVERQ